MKRVIVTDTQYRMALAPMRTLARSGYAVTAAEFSSVAPQARLGFFSRDAHDTLTLGTDDEGFCSAIERAAGSDRPTLLCVNRKSMVLAMRSRERLERCVDLLLPDERAMQTADDKGKMYAVAQRTGVPVPLTTSLSAHKSLEEMAHTVRYPCIIKYRNGEALGLKPAERYTVVRDEKSFLAAYTAMNAVDPDPIASDYIEGHDIGVAVVMDKHGHPVSALCYESLREYPLAGGPTCSLRTVWSPELVEMACRLLTEIGYVGLAMLDFRGTVEQPYFLEINPRVWGSAMIAPVSGSPLFARYVLAARDAAQPLDRSNLRPEYRLGQKMRFTPQSLLCFLACMKQPRKAETLCAYLQGFFDFHVRDGLFALRDPAPYFHYLMHLFGRFCA